MDFERQEKLVLTIASKLAKDMVVAASKRQRAFANDDNDSAGVHHDHLIGLARTCRGVWEHMPEEAYIGILRELVTLTLFGKYATENLAERAREVNDLIQQAKTGEQ